MSSGLRNPRLLVPVAWIGVAACAAPSAPPDGPGRENRTLRDMQTVKERLRSMALGGKPNDGEAERCLESLKPDGSWPDIDYGSQDRARWSPSGHVGRVWRMAQCLEHPESRHRATPALKEAVLRAFDGWVARDPKCPNWWYNVIGVPRQLYRALLLLETHLSDEQLAAGIGILERAKLGMTGQNLVWVAEVTVARGCLQQDAAVVTQAFDRIAGEIRITTGEGIQPDFSFYQHGQQLYSGGYGRGFSSDCPHFAVLARGTAFQFADEKLDILSGYILDGQQWMVRGQTFDYSACGREISRRGGGGARGLISACRNMAALKTPRQAEFEAMAARIEEDPKTPVPPLVGNRHFWRADYMAHHRPAFLASIRMTSKRLVQTETCNAENLLGRHLSDGLIYVYRRGDEYAGIFPLWDWKRLPGTTCELGPDLPATRNGQRGERTFVGGVSDGLHGLAAMDFARGKLAAKKAWFCSEREVVCLGAGVSCLTDNPVLTSINQCHLRGEVLVACGDKAEALAAGERAVDSPLCVLHDGVGYVLPDRARVVVKNETQTGSWYRVSHVHARGASSGGVFSLWIDHGKQARDAAYHYVLLPGVAAADVQAYADDRPVSVLSNTPRLQAVHQREAAVTAAAFWEPAEVRVPGVMRIAVDRACLVLVAAGGGSLRIAVSNPQNEPAEVVVTADRRLRGEGCHWDAAAEATRVRYQLPGGQLAGKSVVRRFAAE